MKSTGIINRVQNYKYFLIYANLFAFFRLIQGIGLVVTPFIDEGRHVVRPGGIEEHAFAGTGMGKAEGLGMQYLPRTEGETVLDVLAVLLRTARALPTGDYGCVVPRLQVYPEPCGWRHHRRCGTVLLE